MNSAGNIIKNNSLAAMQRQASPEIVSAIKKASASTGVDFAYLMEKASAESSFDTDVKSKTSSATGLFQFIEKTWIAMVRDHGDEHGLGEYADKISANGKVTDAQTRKEILELRKDPEAAAAMAAEYASDNKDYLEDRVESDIGPVELYLAHFMGPSGAAGFLQAMETNPVDTAADIFPAAARANRNVFYDAKSGEPRTLAGVYDFFAKKFEGSTQGYATEPEMMVAVADDNEPRMAGGVPTRNSPAYNERLWAHQLYRDTQIQQIRLLAGTQDDSDRTAGGGALEINRDNKRHDELARLGARTGNRQAMIVSPLEIMELAHMETPRARSRYNE